MHPDEMSKIELYYRMLSAKVYAGFLILASLLIGTIGVIMIVLFEVSGDATNLWYAAAACAGQYVMVLIAISIFSEGRFSRGFWRVVGNRLGDGEIYSHRALRKEADRR